MWKYCITHKLYRIRTYQTNIYIHIYIDNFPFSPQVWGLRRLAPTIIVRVTVDHCLHYRPRESWYNTTLQRHRSCFFVAFFFKMSTSIHQHFFCLPNMALLVSEKLVYRFCILALCWLACFSNTHFTPPFGSWGATATISGSLWLGSCVVSWAWECRCSMAFEGGTKVSTAHSQW